MENQLETLVVLDEGNTAFMESSIGSCCFSSFVVMIFF